MASIAAKSQASLARSAVRPRVAARRAVRVSAKYGEGSKYFDLQDMENTTGSWELYALDDKKRYPSLQEEFFARSTDILTRRESLRTFVALAGIGSIATWGLIGSKTLAKLPITATPTNTENGKGGTVRSRL